MSQGKGEQIGYSLTCSKFFISVFSQFSELQNRKAARDVDKKTEAVAVDRPAKICDESFMPKR